MLGINFLAVIVGAVTAFAALVNDPTCGSPSILMKDEFDTLGGS